MLFNDHFVTEYEGHVIEFEAYKGGFFSYACSLFVDNEKVDSSVYGIFFSYFTLRHNINSSFGLLRIKLAVHHTLATSVRLFINEQEIPFKRLV